MKYLGLFIGENVIKRISNFVRTLTIEEPDIPQNIRIKIASLLEVISQLFKDDRYGKLHKFHQSRTFKPAIPDPDVLCKPKLKLFEVESEEVARQISLIEHNFFSQIHPLEFFDLFVDKSSSEKTISIKQIDAFHKKLHKLFDSYLEDAKTKEDQRFVLDKLSDLAAQTIRQLNFSSLSMLNQYLNKFSDFKKKQDYSDILKKSYQFSSREFVDPLIPRIPSLSNDSQRFSDKNQGKSNSFLIKEKVVWDTVLEIARFVHLYFDNQNTIYGFYEIPQIKRVLLQ